MQTIESIQRAESLSLAQYLDYRNRLAAFNAWLGDKYSYRPEEIPPEVPRIDNEERSAIEVYEFNAAPPDRYFLYIQDNRADYRDKLGNVPPIGPYPGVATTWTGDYLGTVFFGQSFRDNFGGTRVPITVRAINGRTYHGTYYKSAGDYARVKRAKGQKRIQSA